MSLLNKRGEGCLYRLVLLLFMLVLTSCGGAAAGDASSDGLLNHDPNTQEAVTLLKQAVEAAEGAERYAMRMTLNQQVVSQNDGDEEQVQVEVAARVEKEPLRMSQTIRNTYEGETLSYTAILADDAYYMHDLDFDLWSQLPAEEVGLVRRSLSDYQVSLGSHTRRLLEAVESGEGLKVSREEGRVRFDVDPSSAAARSFVDDLLVSTLGSSEMEPEVRSSLEVSRLKLQWAVDSETMLPAAYYADMEIRLDYEPGMPVVIAQTLEVEYTDFGRIEPIVVPEEALEAEISPPL